METAQIPTRTKSSARPLYYPKAHLWLIIPFVITLLGFLPSYWSQFTEAPFRQHLHGLSATAWYLLLIMQPWLYHNRPIHYHRKVGFVSVFIAGGVVFSALLVIPFNFISQMPDVAKYGLSFFDIGACLGFSAAVIMAMLYSRNIAKHSRWMISTVLWALMPAMVRLIYIPLMIATEGNSPLSFPQAANVGVLLMMIVLLWMMYKDYRQEKKIYTAYLLALLFVPFFTLMITPMGTNDWWMTWCDAVLAKGMD